MKLEEYPSAKSGLDSLLQIAPRYTEGYLIRSEVMLKQQDTIAAMRDLDKAIEIDRYNPATWSARALLFLQRKKYADAESDLDEADCLFVIPMCI